MKEKTILGISEKVEILGCGGVKMEPAIIANAKIDTGADSSAIWASNIYIDENNILNFTLFDKNSPYYDGEILKSSKFSAAKVRSTTGHEQIRFRVHFTVKIAGRKIKMLMNLSDRSKNNFPVLIGRRSISGKFLVDVSKKNVEIPKIFNQKSIVRELSENPYKFYKKYYKGEES